MRLLHPERVFAPGTAQTVARILPRTTPSERFRAGVAKAATHCHVEYLNQHGIAASATIIEGVGPTDPTLIALHVPRAAALVSIAAEVTHQAPAHATPTPPRAA